MKLRISPAGFSAVFCAAYLALFALKKPLFLFYPVRHEWMWGNGDGHAHVGPVMVWYGLLAGAASLGLLGSVLIPDRWIMNGLRGWLWVWPCAAVAGSAFLLRAFFS